MDRRESLLGLLALGAASGPFPVFAQPPGRTYRVGALLGGGAASMQLYRSALKERLASHGFVEGRNLTIDARGSAGVFHEDRDVARELAGARPDAILVCLARATQAVQAATQSVPIVFAWVGDPVASGLVKDYARPGGNTTGVTNRYGELLVKRLELVRELLPKVKRVGVVGIVNGPLFDALAPAMRQAAPKLGIELVEKSMAGGWEAGLEAAIKAGAEAVLPFAQFAAAGELVSGRQVVELTNRKRIPTVFSDAEMVEFGGLMSYGTDLAEDIRRAADLLAKVLKGARPAHLPVDQASRFELVVNLKTAKALGLTIPQSVLIRADRVVE